MLFPLAILAPLFSMVLVTEAVMADVSILEPVPGGVFQAGQYCLIIWQPDSTSSTAWKDMAVELMTGSDEDPIHLTTVATGQDGTVQPIFNWVCPSVTPPGPIYFYKLTSPHTKTQVYSGRFMITTTKGVTAIAPNTTQPGYASPSATSPSSGVIIPDSGPNQAWGIGALLDAGSAVPPPDFNSTGSGGGSGTTGTFTVTVHASPTGSSNSASSGFQLDWAARKATFVVLGLSMLMALISGLL